MFCYAQLNENGICVGVLQLSGEVQGENTVVLQEYDTSVLGKKYENGKWIEIPSEPENEEPTENDILNAEILLNQTEILINQSNQDEVLAEILLNGLGV